MDAVDIKSDLLALQRLYGLLKSEGDGTRNPASKMLDNNACLILKYLLDSATQKALKVYSEILADQVGLFRTPCVSHLQQTDNTIWELSSGLHMATEMDHCYRNDLGSDRERKANGLDFKNDQNERLIRQRSQVEQSRPCADATGAEFRKKRCRVCQRSTVKKMVSDETAKYPQYEMNNDPTHVPCNIEQETGSLLCYKTNEFKTDKRTGKGPFFSNFGGSSDTMVPTVCKSKFEAIYKREKADSISIEASEAIEQLESCISDLKIGSDHVHQFEGFSGQHENMDSNDVVCKLTSQSAKSPLNYPSHQAEVIDQPSGKVQPMKSMMCQSNGHFSRSGGTSEMREPTEEPKIPIHCQNMKTIRGIIGSGNWRTASNEFGPNAWNVGVAAEHKTSPWTSTFSPVPNMERPRQICLAKKNETNTYGVFQPSKPAYTFRNPGYSEKHKSIDSGLYITSIGGSRVKRHPPNTTATLQECAHQSDRQHENGVATRRNSMTASRSSLNQQVLEDTASTFYSSSTRSQQASSYGSVAEDYSFSDQTGSDYISSSTSSETGVSPQSHGTMRDYDSCTSKSEDNLHSFTRGHGTPEVICSSSGKSDGCSSYNQPMNHHSRSTYSSMKSTSRKKVPGRISKSASGINHKKSSKTWKRLKDRLAIIFHHHHHHHHHHHDNRDDRRQGSHWKRISMGTLFKKHEGKLMHSKQRDEAYGERAVKKMRKSLIHEKHQKGQFHGLVEAFVRHIWHSEKSKVAKGTSGRLALKQQGRRKALKKSGWWKLLQHHRRGKFPKKVHVKLGLGKKKTHLKALRR
ncbi:protein lingerer-like [Dorcoceras hygrometricum]|uniref:Protein lingerer-like n=1 Tax=Dorcoceras hygrometricum TaxID=472368 RepID=A0A2Z7B101_9LAMI|nr:protein lingerer-like [Dorcoceras hygrometricum]